MPGMKLLRHGPPGHERPALLDADGQWRDLSGMLPDIGPAQLAPAALEQLRSVPPASLPLVQQRGRIGVPWAGCGKFVAVGLNYADHAAEAGLPLPAEPVLFMKATSCMAGAEDPLTLPRGSSKTDWEVELGVVIGRRARYIDEREALAHVAGYCVVNDISEREYQLERGGTWDKGKSCDGFGPVGPWLVTADEVPDPQALELWLDVDGQPCQRGSTAKMVFGVAQLLAYISRFMTLEPGDLVTTGTPPGVGLGMKPPRFLRAGQQMRLGIQGLGVQQQRVVEEAGFPAAGPA